MAVRKLAWGVTIIVALAGSASAEDLNPVVGKMGDFVLREADVERLVGYQSPEAQQKLQAEPEQRAGVVRQLLLSKAVAAKAKKEGFDRKPEVKEQLSYIIDNYLAQEYLRKVVVATVTVPEDELKKYYKEHEKEFLIPQTARVRHIYFQAAKDADPEVKKQAKAKAESALQRLRKGEDFAKVAQETSEDGDSAGKGGDIGTISPGKTNSEEFEKAAFALKVGEISPVVETPFGYHIIKVEERQEQRTAPFAEAKEYIHTVMKSQFEQKKAQEFLDQLTKDSGLQVIEAPPAAPEGKGEAK